MAGSALSLGVVAVCATLAVGFAAAGAASVQAVRMAGIADAAALAAADAASGAVTGIPCERATDVATQGGAVLADCRLDGLVATVAVTASIGPLTVRARARAGPP